MPFLSEREVEDLARHCGFVGQNTEAKLGEMAGSEEGLGSEEESSAPI
jgi:hypothetical protein